ncbi:MAG: hypothetical protein U0V54_03545 [Saprospiraceae bacterium]
MEGVEEIISGSDNITFVLLKRVNDNLIYLRNSENKVDKIYAYKDSLWRNYREYEIEDAGVHVIERTYSTGDSLFIRQSFHKEQSNKTSDIELNTPHLRIEFLYYSQNELSIQSVLNIITSLSHLKLNANITPSGCFFCRKFFFKDYLLIYKPVDEISPASFQHIKKKKEEFKYGKLVEVSKVIFNDEFDLMEYPKKEFVKQYPWMEYY